MLANARKGMFDWASGAARAAGPKRWGKKVAAQPANPPVSGLVSFGGTTLGNVFNFATANTTATITTGTATTGSYTYAVNQMAAQQQLLMQSYQGGLNAQQAYGGGGGGTNPYQGAIVASGGAPVTGGRMRVNPGDMITIELPDGAILHAEADGSYRIEDKDAKITYKAARVREFNPFLNASDLLEEFVRYVKGFGVKRGDFMNLPIELFINWLVIRAAEQDGEPPPDVPDPIKMLPAPPKMARCLDCGRFIPEKPRLLGIVFCHGGHMDRYRAKLGRAA